MQHLYRTTIWFFLGFSCLSLSAQDMWNATNIQTTITPFRQLWQQLGFEFVDERPTAEAMRPEGEGFIATPISELFFYAPGGDFEVFTGGIIYHRGGYSLTFKGKPLSLMDFEIRTVPNSFHFDIYGPDNLRWFIVTHAHTLATPGSSTLTYKHGDMTLAPELAARLDLQPLIGQTMGILDMEVALDQPISILERGGCSGNFVGDVDVVLTNLSRPFQMSSNAEVITLSASAKLANEGTADVLWNNAISPSSPIGQHPYLVQHFYMEQDGIFRMLGQSDVKHAFFSVNSDCACAGGHVLYVGCSDTYGASTNVQQFYLAPRDEVNPLTGTWQSLGSHFDGEPVDNERDHGGSADHPDPTTHTLTIDPANLDLPGARYFIEGWYVVQLDINIENSFAYREVDPTPVGNVWSFSDVSNSINGPAINQWVQDGDPDGTSQRIDTNKGRVHFSSKVTPLGNNRYRYTYAVLNIDYVAGINGLTIESFEDIEEVTTQFFDVDTASENDWDIDVTSNRVSFTNNQGHPVKWGTMFTMVVDSRNEPADGQVSLQIGSALVPPIIIPAVTPGESCLLQGNLIDASASWFPTGDIRDLVLVANDLCVSK